MMLNGFIPPLFTLFPFVLLGLWNWLGFPTCYGLQIPTPATLCSARACSSQNSKNS